jgi:hypothetical protein
MINLQNIIEQTHEAVKHVRLAERHLLHEYRAEQELIK